MTIDVETLFTVATAAELLNAGLDLAAAVGLPVTTWRAGDPTRSLYKHLAEVLAARDGATAEFVKSAFLSKATGEWLTVLAAEVYGVERVEATYSDPTVTVSNSLGFLYIWDAGDLTFRSSTTDATFHTTSGGTLAPGGTLELDLIADVAGTGGTVAVDEIDELVTTALGVVVDSSTAAIGLDEQDDDSVKQDCADTRGALSPNGPHDAYEWVVRQEALTSVSTITRSAATLDDDAGEVNVYVAGPNGAVDGPSVTAAQDAVELWSTPLGFTGVVQNATEETIAVTAELFGDDIPASFAAQATAKLATLFARFPIARNDDDYKVARSAISGALDQLLISWGIPEGQRNVVLTLPAADVPYTEGRVPKLGTVIVTEG